jgi:hypothetical protein
MRRSLILVVTVAVFLSWAPAAAPIDAKSQWLSGYWFTTADEDHTPPDWSEFRPDGTYVSTSPSCSRMLGRYHLFAGDIYVTIEIPSKGPVALVFRPSDDKTKLTFTSFRTHHNAVLEKVGRPPCSGI